MRSDATRTKLARRATAVATGLAALGALGAGPGPEPIGACVDQTLVEPEAVCVFLYPDGLDHTIERLVDKVDG